MNGEQKIYSHYTDDLPEFESKATPEERAKKLNWMEQQTKLIVKQHSLGVPVRHVKMKCGCGTEKRLIDMFRCLYCGIYYCKWCAEEHFGMRIYKEQKLCSGYKVFPDGEKCQGCSDCITN